jgi:hypothetical protein
MSSILVNFKPRSKNNLLTKIIRQEGGKEIKTLFIKVKKIYIGGLN